MPKAERGTPKDIGIRIKMKGLQKLKFYCQMCEKQCRDANGFKCHLTSENHLRQMKIFSDNAGGILDSYSKEFERSYVSTLKMRHGTKLVNANNVYQEVISDKQHIHMNSTHWTTLTEFVQYLGKTGKCHVEENERGWYVSYIERDAGILARQEAIRRREEGERAAEEAQAQRMEIQRLEAIKALDRAGGTMYTEPTNIDRGGGSSEGQRQPIKVAAALLKPGSKAKKNKAATTTSLSGFGEEDDDDDDDDEGEQAPPKAPKLTVPPPPPQEVERALKRKAPPQQQQQQQQEQQPNDTMIKSSSSSSKKRHKMDGPKKSAATTKKGGREEEEGWIYKNIIVRVISKTLAGGKYYKRKAVINKVLDKKGYTAEVEILDNDDDDVGNNVGGDILRLDQDDLETVIPKKVLIKNDKNKNNITKVRYLKSSSKYFGEKAIVEYMDKKRQQADLRLCYNDKLLKDVPYEEFSKIAYK